MKRVISTQLQEEDIKIEKSLRPMYFDDYIGQQKIKDNLKIYIEAAKSRGEALDHVLFYGPPGLGTTKAARKRKAAIFPLKYQLFRRTYDA